MSILYRLMGVVALVNQKLSRMRINLVPLNWVVMIGLGILVSVALDEWHDAHANGAAPRPVSVASVLANSSTEKNFVAVQGLLVPDSGFEAKTARSNTPGCRWWTSRAARRFSSSAPLPASAGSRPRPR